MPAAPQKGAGGTRTLAHSIRRCRAAGVAKLACDLRCWRRRRPPHPSLGVFFESHLKKKRSRLHFDAFLHLGGFQVGKKCVFAKFLHTVVLPQQQNLLWGL